MVETISVYLLARTYRLPATYPSKSGSSQRHTPRRCIINYNIVLRSIYARNTFRNAFFSPTKSSLWTRALVASAWRSETTIRQNIFFFKFSLYDFAYQKIITTLCPYIFHFFLFDVVISILITPSTVNRGPCKRNATFRITFCY